MLYLTRQSERANTHTSQLCDVTFAFFCTPYIHAVNAIVNVSLLFLSGIPLPHTQQMFISRPPPPSLPLWSGRSYIFHRAPTGDVTISAEANRSDLSPDSEEVLCVNVTLNDLLA